MHDIHIIPHQTDWWILNGKVRQGPYIDLRLASRIAFAGRNAMQRITVLNQAGEAIMYWPKMLGLIDSVSSADEAADPQST